MGIFLRGQGVVKKTKLICFHFELSVMVPGM